MNFLVADQPFETLTIEVDFGDYGFMVVATKAA
jgi:hypothetical protein